MFQPAGSSQQRSLFILAASSPDCAAGLEYIGLSSDKVPQHVSQQPATTMQPTQFLRVFAFLVVMEAPADGAPSSSPSDGGVGNDNDLPDMMSPLQVPTHCGPCGWIHYRNGNRNLFSRLDVTENIL